MPTRKLKRKAVVDAGVDVPPAVPTPQKPSQRVYRQPRGQKRIRLIHHIAQGEMKPGQLCTMYDLSMKALRDFTKDNEYEIGLVRQDNENEFAGMWITSKRNRLAETEEVVNRANTQLEAWDELIAQIEDAIRDPENAHPRWVMAARALMGGRGDVRSPAPELMKVVLKALRQGAEELGDLKQDVSLHATHLNYTIEGVDPKDMQ
jgi:hypothetical protein